MNIHQLFMMLFIPILIGNVILALQQNALNAILLGIFTGLLVNLLIVGVLSSIQVLGSGLNASGSWLIFSVGFYLTLLFGVKLPLSQINNQLSDVPIGANMVGNLYNIMPFPFNIVILMTGIVLLYAGVQIIIGGRTGG